MMRRREALTALGLTFAGMMGLPAVAADKRKKAKQDALRTTIRVKGIHCQLSPIMMKKRAAQGSAAQAKSPRPTHCHAGAKGPLVVSAIMRKA